MKRILLMALCFCFTFIITAQETRRYDADIEAIKSYDKIYTPTSDPILFVGSSSIRKWDYLQVAFGSYNVINRGIGGAVIDDITYYLNDLVFAYKPRQIVLYVGENNLPDDAQTAEIILAKTKTLYNAIRAKLPEVSIVYIAMKPSPVRDKYQQKCRAANDLIKNFLASEKNTAFVDVFTPMLNNGKSRPELFVEDMLHMKPEGYSLWEKLVKPFLLKQGGK